MTYESVRLLVPALELLPEYVAALERGWSSDNLRVANEIPREELDRIRSDPAAFVELENRARLYEVTPGRARPWPTN